MMMMMIDDDDEDEEEEEEEEEEATHMDSMESTLTCMKTWFATVCRCRPHNSLPLLYIYPGQSVLKIGATGRAGGSRSGGGEGQVGLEVGWGWDGFIAESGGQGVYRAYRRFRMGI
ncbi:hypothetical protein C0Q70_18687 [Pomacea canaliculata]|uniref:Uncharacterized protein n=1 Tax=Pomacea canaliculata TaxID=400727 RepID=A0A2T7NH86_POMCA|nr:hypothetical protein C0Q70_18687 [Pomacea canaliculata]